MEDSASKKIRKAFKISGLKQKEFAERIDIAPGYLSEILSGKKIPSDKLLRVVSAEFGEAEYREPGEPNAEATGMVKIPLYSATAEGGPGAINHRSDVESYLSFTKEYARVQFGSSGNSLACLKAAGDSMAPYIAAGDVLIVDVSDKVLTKDGAAYVLQIDETTVVKRLHRLSREKISIRSDNPHGWNRDCALEEMEAEGIAISGRVVAVIKMA